MSVPLSFYPTLQLATRRERADFEISHPSVYWPKLDCDISSDCLLRGAKEARKFAERAWRKKAGQLMGVESDVILPRDVMESIAQADPSTRYRVFTKQHDRIEVIADANEQDVKALLATGVDTVPITRAPRRFAIWQSSNPTPPAAACTTQVSPGLRGNVEQAR